jgi:hypothetical protein
MLRRYYFQRGILSVALSVLNPTLRLAAHQDHELGAAANLDTWRFVRNDK